MKPSVPILFYANIMEHAHIGLRNTALASLCALTFWLRWQQSYFRAVRVLLDLATRTSAKPKSTDH